MLWLEDHHAERGVSCGTMTFQDSQIVLGRSEHGVERKEFGVKDATDEERKKLHEDDLVAWGMFFFIVASYVRKARGIPQKVKFTWEQPSSPKAYKPEVVSWWDTWHWQELKKEFDFKETQVKHRGLGGSAEKPTTFGGNLDLRPDKHYVGSRWSRRERRRKFKAPKISLDGRQASWPWSPALFRGASCKRIQL